MANFFLVFFSLFFSFHFSFCALRSFKIYKNSKFIAYFAFLCISVREEALSFGLTEYTLASEWRTMHNEQWKAKNEYLALDSVNTKIKLKKKEKNETKWKMENIKIYYWIICNGGHNELKCTRSLIRSFDDHMARGLWLLF